MYMCSQTGVVWKRASCYALYGIVRIRGWILRAWFKAETRRYLYICGIAVKVCVLWHSCSEIETKIESKWNQTDLKGACVLPLPAAFIPHGLSRDMCAPVSDRYVLTSVSRHANEHISVNQEIVPVSHHNNRISKNRGGKTEKRDMACQWYQHSKEVNQAAVHWQRGASVARLAADKTHQFLLGGGQTKSWNVPNCLVSISSSQWQGSPAVLIFHTLSSGELLACVHTHTHTHRPLSLIL